MFKPADGEKYASVAAADPTQSDDVPVHFTMAVKHR